MQTRRGFFLSLIASATAAGWARAASLTEADRAALAALFEEWERATFAGDLVAAMRTMPPALLDRIAKLAGVQPHELGPQMVAIAGHLMPTDLADVGFEVVFDWSRTEFGETNSGRPYVVIPRALRSEVLTWETPVLALRDGGAWYMVQFDNPMVRAILLQSYPDLASVDFSAFPEPVLNLHE
jgi:hypothetical protein